LIAKAPKPEATSIDCSSFFAQRLPESSKADGSYLGFRIVVLGMNFALVIVDQSLQQNFH
jgi:hypothetical protein